MIPAGWRTRRQGEKAAAYLCPGCGHLTPVEPQGFSWGEALQHRRDCAEPDTAYNYPVVVVRE